MESVVTGRPGRVYPIIAFGILSFSFSPILVRYATEAPPLAVAVWRTVIAAAVLAPMGLSRARDEIRAFTKRDIAMIMGGGVLLAGHFVCWIGSLYFTSVASASVLFASNPLVLALMSFAFLRERVSPPVAIAVAVGVAGAILLGVSDSPSQALDAPRPLLGNTLAIIATVLFSFYFLIGRVMRRRTSWLAYVFPLYLVVAIVTVVCALVAGVPLTGYPPKIYLLCAALAIGPQVLGHGSFNYAVKYFTATMLGLFGLLEPIGATIYAYVLFGEVPSGWAIVGILALLCAVTVALVASSRKATPVN